ncbi:Peptidase propeptide and YPEB domain-containing protein [Neptunomonas qingdaonensis]|uniref:Peptidase propeptide and YPEB domain-containing protein n=2 Tax=Neptunomonas qingdaonensis TaxID=1045558 RepID=A0A1I2LYJ5_9GAMM|nr:Peptidase propeptide and YPEB domain-containing protein [Neptunomonas qingdaonensis]
MLLTVLSCAALASDPADTVVMSDAIEIAKKAVGGEVVKADTLTLETGLAYRIRLVNNGHVKEVLVDATSGELLPP